MGSIIDIKFIGKDLASDIAKGVRKNIMSIGDKAVSGAMNGINTAISGIGATLKTVTVGAIALGTALTGAIGVGTKTFMEIEDSMADVRKSVGLTADETLALTDEIMKIGPTTRTSISSLIDIAKVGGQIGIAKDDIVDFTKAVDKVSVALGDEFSGGAEEVTNALGTLKNLYGDLSDLSPQDSMLKVGSAMNALGAAGSATGPSMAEFTNRIGQLGNLAPSITQTLGLGAAMQELGLSAEISSSGLSNIFLTAGSESKVFAEQLGMTEQAFQDLFKSDPNEMILRLADSLKEASKDPVQLAKAMDKMKLGTQESIKVMSLLATKTDFVKDKQALAAKEFSKGTSILDEYNIKNNTLAATLEKAQNRMTAFKNTLGGVATELARVFLTGESRDGISILQNTFGPENARLIADFVANIRHKVDELINWFKSNWPQIKAVLLDVFKQALSIWENTGRPIFNVIIATIQDVIKWVIANWPTIQQIIASVFAKISDIVKTVLIPLFQQVVKWVKEVVNIFMENWPQISKIFDMVVNHAKSVWNTLYPIIKVAIDLIIKAIKFLLPVVLDIAEWFMKTKDKVVGAIMNIKDFVVGAFNWIVANVVPPLVNIFNIVTSVFKNIWGVVSPIISFLKDLIVGAFHWVMNNVVPVLAGIFSHFMHYFTSIKNTVQSIINTAAQIVTGAINWIVNNIVPPLQNIWNIVTQTFTNIKNVVQSIINTAAQIVHQAIEWIVNNIGGPLVRIYNAITEKFSQVKDKVVSIWDGIKEFIGNLATPIISTIEKVFEKVGKVISGIKSALGLSDELNQNLKPWTGYSGVQNFMQTSMAKVNGSFIGPMQQKASGGIVRGSSRTSAGDKVMTRLNEGEMVLDSQQQARLFQQLNGKGQVSGGSSPIFNFNISVSGGTTDAMARDMFAKFQQMLSKSNQATFMGLNNGL